MRTKTFIFFIIVSTFSFNCSSNQSKTEQQSESKNIGTPSKKGKAQKSLKIVTAKEAGIKLIAENRIKKNAAFAFDSFNKNRIEESGQSFTLQNSKTIKITGWAYDAESMMKANNVVIQIGKKAYVAKYNIASKNLAKLSKNDALSRCRFELIIPSRLIEKGKNKVSLKILSSSNPNEFYAPNFHFYFQK